MATLTATATEGFEGTGTVTVMVTATVAMTVEVVVGQEVVVGRRVGKIVGAYVYLNKLLLLSLGGSATVVVEDEEGVGDGDPEGEDDGEDDGDGVDDAEGVS